ncbi:MAG: DedA family protein [Bdellovibrionales bacterium]|nr:DedA family protein [Bdellovibrionales bacterium]
MDALVDFLLNFYGPVPYLIVFAILLACGLGVPIPEDITLIVGGLLSYYGLCNVWVMIAVCFLGVMIGDSAVFWLGAKYGRTLTKKWFFRKALPEERMDAVRAKFKKHGNKFIFAGRFLPGLRAPIFFSAGVLHLPFRVFFAFDGLAALVSVPTIVWVVYHFGDHIDRVINRIKNTQSGIITVIVVIAFIYLLRRWRRKSSASITS